MEINDEILTRSEQIQTQFHSLMGQLKEERPSASYGDVHNTILYMMIAELELRLEKLEAQKSFDDKMKQFLV